MRRGGGCNIVLMVATFAAGYWLGWSTSFMRPCACPPQMRCTEHPHARDAAAEVLGGRQGGAGGQELAVRRQEEDRERERDDDAEQKDEVRAEGDRSYEVYNSRGKIVMVDGHGIDLADADDDENQQRALRGEQLSWQEIEALPMYRKVFAADKLPSGRRVLLCPRWRTEQDILQIPLKHLPRKKPTSVDQKYDRRAGNCLKDGIWHKISLEDHKKILAVIEKLLGVEKGQHIFDWGSGCGHKLRFIAEKHKLSGFGLDVSEKSVEYSLVNTTKENHFCRANGVRIDEWMPENYYDHALSFGSVYHVYNRTTFCSVLRSMVRVVREGGRVYNGWTENAEYRRLDVAPCLRDLPVKFEILEEKKLFSKVPIFPLKAQQTIPNTYSLLITKLKATKPGYWTYVPVNCDKFKCEERPYPELEQ